MITKSSLTKNNLYFLNSPCGKAWPYPFVSPTPPWSRLSPCYLPHCLWAHHQLPNVHEVSPKSLHLVQCRVLDPVHSIPSISCWLPITCILTICVRVWFSSTWDMREEPRVHLFYFLLGSTSCLEHSRLSSNGLIRRENISMSSTVVRNS